MWTCHAFYRYLKVHTGILWIFYDLYRTLPHHKVLRLWTCHDLYRSSTGHTGPEATCKDMYRASVGYTGHTVPLWTFHDLSRSSLGHTVLLLTSYDMYRPSTGQTRLLWTCHNLYWSPTCCHVVHTYYRIFTTCTGPQGAIQFYCGPVVTCTVSTP